MLCGLVLAHSWEGSRTQLQPGSRYISLSTVRWSESHGLKGTAAHVTKHEEGKQGETVLKFVPPIQQATLRPRTYNGSPAHGKRQPSPAPFPDALGSLLRSSSPGSPWRTCLCDQNWSVLAADFCEVSVHPKMTVPQPTVQKEWEGARRSF